MSNDSPLEISPSPLLRVPTEVFLLITSFLDVPEIISLRQTCTLIFQITQDTSIWISLLRTQHLSLPLPPDVRHTISSLAFVGLSSSILESIVTSTYRIAKSWSLPRPNPPLKLQPKSGESLLGLQLFMDRWLLSVYSEGLAYLWDISSEGGSGGRLVNSPGIRCASLDMGYRGWTSYVAALDSDNENVIMTVTRGQGPTTTHIYKIPLTRPSLISPNTVQLLHIIFSPPAEVIRAIDPIRKLIAFSHLNFVNIVCWGNGDQRVALSTQTHDLEELWNGIIALRFTGPYVLVVKTHSVELCPLPPAFQLANTPRPHLPNLKHTFSHTTFREVSISGPVSTSDSETESTKQMISFGILAYDVIQGLFHYSIHISIPHLTANVPSPAPPSLDVKLVGVYAMANNIRALSPPTFSARSGFLGQTVPPGFPLLLQDTHTLSPLHIAMPETLGGSGSNAGRGFVAALCLGPQAKRAVWIERRRGSTVREVIVWAVPRTGEGIRSDGMAVDESGSGEENMLEMDGRVVHTVTSYDLREDLSHCVFDEVSGRIVLGNRSGDVFVLGLGV